MRADLPKLNRSGCTLYMMTELCTLCVGVIMHARIVFLFVERRKAYDKT